MIKSPELRREEAAEVHDELDGLNLSERDLSDATLPRLLFFGLATGDIDAAHAVLWAARDELRAVVGLMRAASGHEEPWINMGEAGALLDGILRRLSVGIALSERAHRRLDPAPADVEAPKHGAGGAAT